MATFTSPQVRQLTAVNGDTLRKWVTSGAVRPLNAQARPGSGRCLLFSEKALFAVAVGASLKRCGASSEVASRAVRFCDRADLTKRFAAGERFLVIQGERLFVCTEESVLQRQGGPGVVAGVIALDLERTHAVFLERLKASGQGQPGQASEDPAAEEPAAQRKEAAEHA